MADLSRGNHTHNHFSKSKIGKSEQAGLSGTGSSVVVEHSSAMTTAITPQARFLRWQALLLPFLSPLVVLLAVLNFSPNFQWVETSPGAPLPFRKEPYGGDFLQDWVGGKIASVAENRELLYSTDRANQIQHSELVGFSWPKEKYFPMVYPPYYYWLVSPFSYLPYRYSAITWTVLSTIAFILAGWILYVSHPPLVGKAWPLMLAMTAFVPWVIALGTGQKSTWLLLLFAATYGMFIKDRRFLAGLVFGLVAIKPQLGIVVGLAMMLNRQWAFVAGAAVSVLGLLVLACCLNGLWLDDYKKVVTGMGDYTSTGGYELHNSHSLIAGLKMIIPSSWGVNVTLVGIVLGVIVTLVVSWDDSIRRGAGAGPNQVALQFSNLVFATVLVSPHFYTYDLTILLLPMVLVISSLTPPIAIEAQHDRKGGDEPSSGRTGVRPTQFGTMTVVQILVVLMFVVAGMLAKLNLQTGLPCGMIMLLAIAIALTWHLQACQVRRLLKIQLP